jgi:hypothetical protein
MFVKESWRSRVADGPWTIWQCAARPRSWARPPDVAFGRHLGTAILAGTPPRGARENAGHTRYSGIVSTSMSMPLVGV